MKTFRDYLAETDKKKTKTDTKDKTDWDALDDLFKKKDTSVSATPAQDTPQDAPQGEPPAPELRRAGQSDTRRATQNIEPNQRMRDLLGRMRDIDADPEDPGYPEPDDADVPVVRVDINNLPTVAGQRLQAAGIQNPNFHQVANLPGNMSRAIRTMGKQLFRSFTRTPTEDIWMIGNLGGQGPNSTSEVNAVAQWVRQHGEDLGDGDIDFDSTIPGYTATIRQYSAGGIRWLLVQDEFGNYIYSWPESDSREHSNTPAIGHTPNRLPNR